jgi:hypothetical protein
MKGSGCGLTVQMSRDLPVGKSRQTSQDIRCSGRYTNNIQKEVYSVTLRQSSAKIWRYFTYFYIYVSGWQNRTANILY